MYVEMKSQLEAALETAGKLKEQDEGGGNAELIQVRLTQSLNCLSRMTPPEPEPEPVLEPEGSSTPDDVVPVTETTETPDVTGTAI